MSTIKDVARHAGVSISTVSHVLNGTRFVSEDKAREVHDAVAALGYKRSAVARSLKTNKTHTIGMLAGSNANPFFAEVIHGVEASCYERGYHLVLCNSENDLEKQSSYLNKLEEKRIDGLLVMSAHNEPALFDILRQRCQWPLVVLDCQVPELDADIIMESPELGGYEATRYLLENGHKSIGCLSGPAELSPSSQRLAGYRRALEEAGLSADDDWIVEGRLTAESGFESANRLLDNLPAGKQPPSALFVGNDLMAMGAMCALQTRGYKVPEDISLVGYDNIELSAFTSPPLTTIHQPKGELGRLAANTLIDRIENSALQPETRILRSTLVERESVRLC